MLAIRVVCTFRDDSGDTAQTEFKIPTGLSITDMTEAAVQIGTLVASLTKGALVGVTIALDIDLNLFAAPLRIALDTADVEEKGYFQFATANGFNTKMSIPCIREDIVVAGTDNIDQTDVDVAAFILAMESGITTTTNATLVEPTDIRGDDVVDLEVAEERFS